MLATRTIAGALRPANWSFFHSVPYDELECSSYLLIHFCLDTDTSLDDDSSIRLNKHRYHVFTGVTYIVTF